MFSSGVSWPHCSAVVREVLAVRPGETNSRPFILQPETGLKDKPERSKYVSTSEPGPSEAFPFAEVQNCP